MRRTLVVALSCATLIAGVTAGLSTATAQASAGQASTSPDRAREYLVLLKDSGALDAGAKQAIAQAGGRITETNTKVGYVYVTTDDAGFEADLNRSGQVAGIAQERTIGHAPKATARAPRRDSVEHPGGDKVRGDQQSEHRRKGGSDPAPTTPEPLASRQWDMRQIGATPAGSYARNQGSKKVLVGIIDTGVDGSHPDIAPNFDAKLSRNFVTDMPDIDGDCEVASCVDPADADDNGHGTHVASTIGSPINGLGMAGVAPNVTLVNLRAGQDSGYFFLKGTLDALTYAADHGVDVVNMSFYVDPWLFNCTDNAADSAAERREQQVIRTATQRAIDYARDKGVLPIAALGNEATDLNRPTSDTSSPDYPEGAAKERVIDNSCITVPTESRGVVSVSSTGPSLRKAYYSNFGTEQTDVAAPGGDAYDSPTGARQIESAILAAYPESVARAEGSVDADGNPTTTAVVKSCQGDTCGYYEYLQGTSMASPHAVGVAALIVSAHGKTDRRHGGLTLDPRKTERLLYDTAQPQACPSPATFHYTRYLPDGSVAEADHTCTGSIAKNGFYGHGIVNAFNAVTRR